MPNDVTHEPGIHPARPTPPDTAVGWVDRWDLAILLALPALAVLLACAATPPDVLPNTNPDMLLYYRVAGQVAAGQVPYLDFSFEYPPLALVPIVAPYLVWPGGSPALLDYQWLWAIQNGALAALVAALVGWLAARGASGLVPVRAIATWALVALLQVPLVAWRFDITAVALAVGGVALVVAGRPGPPASCSRRVIVAIPGGRCRSCSPGSWCRASGGGAAAGRWLRPHRSRRRRGGGRASSGSSRRSRSCPTRTPAWSRSRASPPAPRWRCTSWPACR